MGPLKAKRGINRMPLMAAMFLGATLFLLHQIAPSSGRGDSSADLNVDVGVGDETAWQSYEPGVSAKKKITGNDDEDVKFMKSPVAAEHKKIDFIKPAAEGGANESSGKSRKPNLSSTPPLLKGAGDASQNAEIKRSSTGKKNKGDANHRATSKLIGQSQSEKDEKSLDGFYGGAPTGNDAADLIGSDQPSKKSVTDKKSFNPTGKASDPSMEEPFIDAFHDDKTVDDFINPSSQDEGEDGNEDSSDSSLMVADEVISDSAVNNTTSTSGSLEDAKEADTQNSARKQPSGMISSRLNVRPSSPAPKQKSSSSTGHDPTASKKKKFATEPSTIVPGSSSTTADKSTIASSDESLNSEQQIGDSENSGADEPYDGKEGSGTDGDTDASQRLSGSRAGQPERKLSKAKEVSAESGLDARKGVNNIEKLDSANFANPVAFYTGGRHGEDHPSAPTDPMEDRDGAADSSSTGSAGSQIDDDRGFGGPISSANGLKNGVESPGRGVGTHNGSPMDKKGTHASGGSGLIDGDSKKHGGHGLSAITGANKSGNARISDGDN